MPSSGAFVQGTAINTKAALDFQCNKLNLDLYLDKMEIAISDITVSEIMEE